MESYIHMFYIQFSHQNCPKNDPLPVDPYNIDE